MEMSGIFQRYTLAEPNFIGRSNELDWLRNQYVAGMGQHRALVVSGAAGVGKTTLIKHFLSLTRLSVEPIWLDVNAGGRPNERVDRFITQLDESGSNGKFLAVVDGAESLSDKKLEYIISCVFNIKEAQGLILITRSNPSLKRVDVLRLENLSIRETLGLISSRIEDKVFPDSLELLVEQARRSSVSFNILIQLLTNRDFETARKLLSGSIYNLFSEFEIPESEIITSLKPEIISANDRLIEKLRRQPDSIYDLEPIRFEELLAELLTDMGWDVELTKATRDGGKDMLAYLDTELGRILCLV